MEMNKTAIKNFSIWARNALMDQVRTQMRLLGITEERIAEPLPQSAGHTQFFDIGTDQPYQIDGKAVDQRAHLVDHLRAQEKEEEGGYASAYEHVVEEAAYTWFNRLIAVRFMEVNGYLPWHVRVLSSESAGKIEPDLVSEPFSADGDIEMTDEEKREILAMMEAQDADGLFSAMFLKACNALNKVLPKLFEKSADWTELLLNLSFVDRDGVVWHLVHDIPEEDFNVQQGGQVEIIGWMYQYYVSERHNQVVDALHGKSVKKEDVPAATQLFTPDWIVQYIVDNSLGKFWMERNPDSSLADKLQFLVVPKDGFSVVEDNVAPDTIRYMDNSMGSGHFLVYAFDVLMEIYRSLGWRDRDAAQNIVKYNLYGLDIDERAAQLAYFAVMMKAREYDRRFLERKITPHVYAIRESNDIKAYQMQYLGVSMDIHERDRAEKQLQHLLEEYKDAKEYGSILHVDPFDHELLHAYIQDCKMNESNQQVPYDAIGILDTQEELQHLIDQANLMTMSYDVVDTNPPYLNKYDAKLKKYITENYADYKSDLFSVFIKHNSEMCKPGGYSGFMTPMVWMFIKSYEPLRNDILENKMISTLIQFEYSAYEEATVPICTFVIENKRADAPGLYFRLSDFTGGMDVQKQKVLDALKNRDCGYYYESSQSNFSKIPGSPVAYWASENMIKDFDNPTIAEFGFAGIGMRTGDNNRFLRLWNEVSVTNMFLHCESREQGIESNRKWIPYNKGGNYRKWYGNNSYVVNWYRDGFEIKENTKKVYPQLGDNLGWKISNESYYFKPGITWSGVTSSKFSCRCYGSGFIFDSGANGLFAYDNKNRMYLAALLNTNLVSDMLGLLNPTINTGSGTINEVPVIDSDIYKEKVNLVTKENVDLSKSDWDSFETSWDFQAHPFILCRKEHAEDEQYGLVENCYQAFKQTCEERFCRLKENEEELNRIFIDIYGLQDELTPEESGGDVTVARVYDEKKDIPEEMKRNKYVLTREDVMKSLISYAVGCMFGRYSLDEPGLAYAGGSWDPEKYRTFLPDEDNVIPITDEEYFRDDIVGRFCAWLKAAFGEQNLEQNLDYVASSLHVKGDSSREIIRNYFLKDFFKDHCKTYSVTGSGKRPIYWLFDSGKQNGFKALIYMHRYDKNTIGRLRVEYLHRIQRVYDAEIARMQDVAERSGNASERARASKRAEKLIRQQAECRKYDENISHLALSEIEIDLDDGVKVNYEKVQTASDGKKYPVLAKI
jgi:hypothetical protein